MDESRGTQRSGYATVVVMLIVVLVLAYAGGYVYYRSTCINTDPFGTISVNESSPTGKPAFYLYYPAAWIEAHVRGGELDVFYYDVVDLQLAPREPDEAAGLDAED